MKNILIVDDNRYFATGLSMNLVLLVRECNVITARNGEKAAEIMGSLSLDCLVTDLGMRMPDGGELAEYAANAYPGLPVFVLAGSGKETGAPPGNRVRQAEKGLGFRKLAGFISSELGALFRDAFHDPVAAACTGRDVRR
jgi:CheY-like chemotaxis protein